MIDDEYKVSIITVVYNGAETIEQTILSVLAQTYKNIEYIIIDGLSTDGTQQIVNKYADSIACFVSEKDAGIYDAMNKGIKISTGNIIGIINSDDWYEKDAVEKAVHCFEQGEADLVHGKINFVYSDGSEKTRCIFALETLWYQMAIAHPSVFVKRTIYDKFGNFDLRYKLSADYELMLRWYSSQQVRFQFLDCVMAHFRVGGLSKRMRKKGVEEDKLIAMKYIGFCSEKEKNLIKIEEYYEWDCFALAVAEEKNVLSELLCKFFNKKKLDLIVFGAGIWGEKCYEALKDGKIKVSMFVDNDSSKWQRLFHGIKVAQPEEIKDIEAYVLIANKNYGENIKQQLNKISNGNLKCVSLEELKELYVDLWIKKTETAVAF